MRPTFSDSLVPVLIGGFLAAPSLAAQDPVPQGPILSSDISLSREAAVLRLELQDGRELTLDLTEDGVVRLNGDQIGAYDRRDGLDRAWRDLLQQAMDAPATALPTLLRDWEPPAGASAVAQRLDRELEAAMSVAADAATGVAQEDGRPAADMSDSITRLHERIRELERLIEDPDLGAEGLANLPALRELRIELEEDLRDEIRRELRSEIRGSARNFGGWNSPLRHITRGIGGVFTTLMVYAILVGIGFLAVFFGRTHLEGIADTARHATLRSGLVGLAGGFLVAPAFILGTLALTISIVGIPLLLVWLPGFWVAVVFASVGGFLAVAHGAGEAFAERRFTGTEWFTRANSYYYVMTGVGLLLVLYIGASVVSMAGPWVGFIEGLLRFMAVMVTVIASLIGFGAVLISRGGTRPVRHGGLSPDPDLGGAS
ncbi:MAG TPA: hypothetical protein VMM83_07140 [Longimicrobiales bacterium]|nr:hypothetical protein [Longimicrobiales bacterium]